MFAFLFFFLSTIFRTFNALYILKLVVNRLTPRGDLDRISLNNINTISSRWVLREKKIITYRELSALSPNSPTDMIRILWQTIGRITKEIFGVKGLKTSPHFWKGEAYRLMNKDNCLC